MQCLVHWFYSAYVIIRTTGNHFSCLSYSVALLRQVSPCLCANHYAHLHKCSHSCNWPTYTSTCIPRTCVQRFHSMRWWYLNLSYLDGMPNSNIPHQTSVMMMRISHILFIERLSTFMEQAGPYRSQPSRLVRRNRGLEGGLYHYLWHQSGWKVTHFFQPIGGPSRGYITIAVFGDVA